MSTIQLADQAVDAAALALSNGCFRTGRIRPHTTPLPACRRRRCCRRAGTGACRRVDVSALMSPVQLAEQAVGLNLRLMRWRAAPGLDVERTAAARCLLLGERPQEHECAACEPASM